MPITRSGHFSYLRTPTTWQSNEAWRARRSKMTKAYLNDAAAAQSGFTTAWTNQVAGTASLAAQSAVDRIHAATNVLRKSVQSIDLSA
jgi:hypothetical protein